MSDTKYIIKDWAYNTMFNGKEFDTFDEAWSHIMINDQDEELDDYQVIEIK